MATHGGLIFGTQASWLGDKVEVQVMIICSTIAVYDMMLYGEGNVASPGLCLEALTL